VRRHVSPGEERYGVEADGAGVLVLRDSYTPSWRATIDGRPARVLRANGRHRGVPLEAGRHDVRVFYAPPFLRAGLALSGLAGFLVAVVLLRRPLRRSPEDEVPEPMV
jgi:uncharacterized membrane protein YfhO